MSEKLSYRMLRTALKEEEKRKKEISNDLFNNLEPGEKIELSVEGKLKQEIFVGFTEWYPGCKQKYQKIPTTIFENEQGEILERKILDYDTLEQDPRIISESVGSVLKKIDSSSELSKQYKQILEEVK